MKIREISHHLPSGSLENPCSWEGVALNGFDCIVEIPKAKWDLDACALGLFLASFEAFS